MVNHKMLRFLITSSAETVSSYPVQSEISGYAQPNSDNLESNKIKRANQ